jgi:deoxycytidine triphosphate deaminase
MFIHPKVVISNGWITHPVYKTLEDWEYGKHLQPNAIDFDLATLHKFSDQHNGLWLSETYKVMRKLDKIEPKQCGNTGTFFEIPGNSVVDFSSSMYCRLPRGVAAYLVVRSTLNRNGLFLTSGLYDSGFNGPVAGTIHNKGPVAHIAPGTRIGQIIFIRSEISDVLYSGNYNVSEGNHWTDK